MNREYYGTPTTANEDFLMHYGVRGMKWGVRKAKQSGNAKRLSRHYRAATRKLQQLTARTDRDLVEKVRKANNNGAVANSIGSALAGGALTYAMSPGPSKKRRAILSAATGVGIGLGTAAGYGIDNMRLKRMNSIQGHSKNEAKRRQFEKEMRKAFRGTKYAKKIDSTKRDISKNINAYKQILSESNEQRRNSNGRKKKNRRR